MIFYYFYTTLYSIEKEKDMSNEVIRGVLNAAKFLQVHRDTIHRHIKKGTFPTPISAMALGENEDKAIRIWKQSDLKEWKEQRKTHDGRGWKISKKRTEKSH